MTARVLLVLFAILGAAGLAAVLVMYDQGPAAPPAADAVESADRPGSDRARDEPNVVAPAAPRREAPAPVTAGEPAGSDRQVVVDEEGEDGRTLTGTVADPFGRPLYGAKVIAYVPGTHGIGGTVVAHTTSDPAGTWFLRVPPRRDDLRLHATLDGYEGSRQLARAGRNDLVLQPLQDIAIAGRLVDLGGSPLRADDLRFLFPPGPSVEPQGPDAIYPAVPGSCGVFVVAEGEAAGGPPPVPAVVDEETASFHVDAPPFAGGTVVLRFRGEDIGRHPWSGGSDAVRFVVDMKVVRAAGTTLAIRVQDGAGEAVEDAVIVLERGRSPRDLPPARVRVEAGRARVHGVPAGRYRVSAELSGTEVASQEFDASGSGDRDVLLRIK